MYAATWTSPLLIAVSKVPRNSLHAPTNRCNRAAISWSVRPNANCITGAVGSMISKRAECTFSQGPEYGTHAAVHVFRCSLPALGIQVEAPGGTVST